MAESFNLSYTVLLKFAYTEVCTKTEIYAHRVKWRKSYVHGVANPRIEDG